MATFPFDASRIVIFKTDDLLQPTCAGFLPSIQRLVTACFPLQVVELDGENDADPVTFLSRLTGFHNADECLWVLLLGGMSQHESSTGNEELIGFATLAPYASSAYVANLCIDPQFQRRGMGRHLLEYSQHYVFTTFGITELCGSVEAGRADLHALYNHLGAEALPRHSFGSESNEVQATVTRFRFRFTAEQVKTLEGKLVRDPLGLRSQVNNDCSLFSFSRNQSMYATCAVASIICLVVFIYSRPRKH